MRNIMAIAQKELKSYFSSPIGYIVIGFWAFLYGVAFVATFGVALMLWVITWFNFSGPPWSTLTQYLSIIEQFDDFGKGVVDTSHLIYYVSFITFGLFLTAKSVESERWRG